MAVISRCLLDRHHQQRRRRGCLHTVLCATWRDLSASYCHRGTASGMIGEVKCTAFNRGQDCQSKARKIGLDCCTRAVWNGRSICRLIISSCCCPSDLIVNVRDANTFQNPSLDFDSCASSQTRMEPENESLPQKTEKKLQTDDRILVIHRIER